MACNALLTLNGANVGGTIIKVGFATKQVNYGNHNTGNNNNNNKGNNNNNNKGNINNNNNNKGKNNTKKNTLSEEEIKKLPPVESLEKTKIIIPKVI